MCEFHYIHIYYLIKMLKYFSNIQLHLFISKFVLNNIYEIDSNILNDVKLYLYTEKKNMFLYNYHLSKKSKKLDIIIINSLIGGRKKHFSYLFLRPKCKYILIDATNGMPYIEKIKAYKWSFIFKYFAYKISYWHLENADKLIYHSREAMKKVSKYTKKPKLFLPFTLFNNKLKNKIHANNRKLIITMTGGIEKERKNYSIFFKSLSILLENNPTIVNKIKIVFLGTIKSSKNRYGISVLERAKNYNNKYGKIIQYYEKFFIPEKDYRNILNHTDILLNIINLNYYVNGKDCSGVGESIIYSIPGIYPKGYKLYRELYSSSTFYNDAESLAKNIDMLANSDSMLQKLKNNAVKNSQKFSIERYRDILYDFIIR